MKQNYHREKKQQKMNLNKKKQLKRTSLISFVLQNIVVDSFPVKTEKMVMLSNDERKIEKSNERAGEK